MMNTNVFNDNTNLLDMVNFLLIERGEEPLFKMDAKCCICGGELSLMQSHNPYPVRPESHFGEKENRCCSDCNDKIVFPARMYLYCYRNNTKKYKNQMNKLRTKDYAALCEIFKENPFAGITKTTANV